MDKNNGTRRFGTLNTRAALLAAYAAKLPDRPATATSRAQVRDAYGLKLPSQLVRKDENSSSSYVESQVEIPGDDATGSSTSTDLSSSPASPKARSRRSVSARQAMLSLNKGKSAQSANTGKKSSTKKLLYRCPLCGTGFTYKNNLFKHARGCSKGAEPPRKNGDQMLPDAASLTEIDGDIESTFWEDTPFPRSAFVSAIDQYSQAFQPWQNRGSKEVLQPSGNMAIAVMVQEHVRDLLLPEGRLDLVPEPASLTSTLIDDHDYSEADAFHLSSS